MVRGGDFSGGVGLLLLLLLLLLVLCWECLL
jgi:hypothetical protein